MIGAGASGLAVLRELLREGHDATVFEQGPRPGGTWVYEETSPTSDGARVLPAALLPAKPAAGAQPRLARTGVKHADAVHSSMYKHLRTNLPRELMGCAARRAETPAAPAAPGRCGAPPGNPAAK